MKKNEKNGWKTYDREWMTFRVGHSRNLNAYSVYEF